MIVYESAPAPIGGDGELMPGTPPGGGSLSARAEVAKPVLSPAEAADGADGADGADDQTTPTGHGANEPAQSMSPFVVVGMEQAATEQPATDAAAVIDTGDDGGNNADEDGAGGSVAMADDSDVEETTRDGRALSVSNVSASKVSATQVLAPAVTSGPTGREEQQQQQARGRAHQELDVLANQQGKTRMTRMQQVTRPPQQELHEQRLSNWAAGDRPAPASASGDVPRRLIRRPPPRADSQSVGAPTKASKLLPAVQQPPGRYGTETQADALARAKAKAKARALATGQPIRGQPIGSQPIGSQPIGGQSAALVRKAAPGHPSRVTMAMEQEQEPAAHAKVARLAAGGGAAVAPKGLTGPARRPNAKTPDREQHVGAGLAPKKSSLESKSVKELRQHATNGEWIASSRDAFGLREWLAAQPAKATRVAKSAHLVGDLVDSNNDLDDEVDADGSDMHDDGGRGGHAHDADGNRVDSVQQAEVQQAEAEAEAETTLKAERLMLRAVSMEASMLCTLSGAALVETVTLDLKIYSRPHLLDAFHIDGKERSMEWLGQLDYESAAYSAAVATTQRISRLMSKHDRRCPVSSAILFVNAWCCFLLAEIADVCSSQSSIPVPAAAAPAAASIPPPPGRVSDQAVGATAGESKAQVVSDVLMVVADKSFEDKLLSDERAAGLLKIELKRFADLRAASKMVNGAFARALPLALGAGAGQEFNVEVLRNLTGANLRKLYQCLVDDLQNQVRALERFAPLEGGFERAAQKHARSLEAIADPLRRQASQTDDGGPYGILLPPEAVFGAISGGNRSLLLCNFVPSALVDGTARSWGRTLLETAADHGQLGSVELLVEAGAPVTNSAIHAAIAASNKPDTSRDTRFAIVKTMVDRLIALRSQSSSTKDHTSSIPHKTNALARTRTVSSNGDTTDSASADADSVFHPVDADTAFHAAAADAIIEKAIAASKGLGVLGAQDVGERDTDGVTASDVMAMAVGAGFEEIVVLLASNGFAVEWVGRSHARLGSLMKFCRSPDMAACLLTKSEQKLCVLTSTEFGPLVEAVGVPRVWFWLWQQHLTETDRSDICANKTKMVLLLNAAFASHTDEIALLLLQSSQDLHSALDPNVYHWPGRQPGSTSTAICELIEAKRLANVQPDSDSLYNVYAAHLARISRASASGGSPHTINDETKNKMTINTATATDEKQDEHQERKPSAGGTSEASGAGAGTSDLEEEGGDVDASGVAGWECVALLEWVARLCPVGYQRDSDKRNALAVARAQMWKGRGPSFDPLLGMGSLVPPLPASLVPILMRNVTRGERHKDIARKVRAVFSARGDRSSNNRATDWYYARDDLLDIMADQTATNVLAEERYAESLKRACEEAAEQAREELWASLRNLKPPATPRAAPANAIKAPHIVGTQQQQQPQQQQQHNKRDHRLAAVPQFKLPAAVVHAAVKRNEEHVPTATQQHVASAAGFGNPLMSPGRKPRISTMARTRTGASGARSLVDRSLVDQTSGNAQGVSTTITAGLAGVRRQLTLDVGDSRRKAAAARAEIKPVAIAPGNSHAKAGVTVLAAAGDNNHLPHGGVSVALDAKHAAVTSRPGAAGIEAMMDDGATRRSSTDIVVPPPAGTIPTLVAAKTSAGDGSQTFIPPTKQSDTALAPASVVAEHPAGLAPTPTPVGPSLVSAAIATAGGAPPLPPHAAVAATVAEDAGATSNATSNARPISATSTAAATTDGQQAAAATAATAATGAPVSAGAGRGRRVGKRKSLPVAKQAHAEVAGGAPAAAAAANANAVAAANAEAADTSLVSADGQPKKKARIESSAS
jgi:hypothetical protein